jgi:phage gp36-like protein
MAYCTQSDILEQLDEDRLVQLTDDDNAGVVDSDVVTRSIADADAEIDGYCGTRYDLPFSPVPLMIRKLSVDIGIYNLFVRRKGVPEDRQKRYDNAIKFLVNVSKGIISLGSDAPSVDDDSGPEATTVKSDRVFSRGRDSDSSVGTLDNY